MNKWIVTGERLLSLLVVFLLLAATAVSAGKWFGRPLTMTQEEGNKATPMLIAAPTPQQLAALGLKGATLTEKDTAIWRVTTPAGQNGGTILRTDHFAPDVKGFAGPVPLFVFIDKDSIVQQILPLENTETPSFFTQAAQVLEAWQGKKAHDLVQAKVDAVSGATFSSRAINLNVQAALVAYEQQKVDAFPTPALGWPKTIAVFLVLGFGLLAATALRGRRWVRLLALSLNVLVCGFWCGQFISVSLLRGWLMNGFDLLLVLPTFAMLLLAILMPYFGKKNYYCQWVCPYGALQDLALRLPLPKVRIPAKAYKRLRNLRFYVLMVLLVLLWFGYGAWLLDYEPFSGFLFSVAPLGVVIFSASFIGLSLFIPRPWCTFFCPVGTLLNIAEDLDKKPNNVKKK